MILHCMLQASFQDRLLPLPRTGPWRHDAPSALSPGFRRPVARCAGASPRPAEQAFPPAEIIFRFPDAIPVIISSLCIVPDFPAPVRRLFCPTDWRVNFFRASNRRKRGKNRVGRWKYRAREADLSPYSCSDRK